jgi:hypothetical protein
MESPKEVIGNRTKIKIRRVAIIHLSYMTSYWASILVMIIALYLFHNPEWFSVVSFDYELFALFLSVLPILLVMSVNLARMQKLMEVGRAERTPLFVGSILAVVAFLLLIPISWFMSVPIGSLLIGTGIVISVAWFMSIIYVVIAGAIVSSNPKQFVKRPQFWLIIGLTSLLIIVSFVPLVAGLLGSEAWQYYTFFELLIRRLPIFALLIVPASILLPILPLTLMFYASDREIIFQWE